MNNYGQKDIPEIILYANYGSYNISEWYKDYHAFHETGNESSWSVDLDVLPEGLKESLYNGVYEATITETHRSVQTGEDEIYIYRLRHPKVRIIESASNVLDQPLEYNITITGQAIRENKK